MSEREQEGKRRSGTLVRGCTCNNRYQDQRYGSGQRVHNLAIKDRNPKEWRCTVCGSAKQL